MTSPKLRPQGLQRGAAFWSAMIPAGVTLANILDAGTWSLHADRLHVGDLVRYRATDSAFDVMVAVQAKQPGGVVVELWPKLPAGYGTDAAGAAAHED